LKQTTIFFFHISTEEVSFGDAANSRVSEGEVGGKFFDIDGGQVSTYFCQFAYGISSMVDPKQARRFDKKLTNSKEIIVFFNKMKLSIFNVKIIRICLIFFVLLKIIV
jgi:hypothetical protein